MKIIKTGKNMSNFKCEKCGADCLDSDRGYTTGCEHYPPDLISSTPTKDQIKMALSGLAHDMRDVGIAMEYLGGFNDGWKEKSAELIGASEIARNWFDEIEG